MIVHHVSHVEESWDFVLIFTIHSFGCVCQIVDNYYKCYINDVDTDKGTHIPPFFIFKRKRMNVLIIKDSNINMVLTLFR